MRPLCTLAHGQGQGVDVVTSRSKAIPAVQEEAMARIAGLAFAE